MTGVMAEVAISTCPPMSAVQAGAPPLNGTCTICHDTPNVGNHSVPMALNIGVADASLQRRIEADALSGFRLNAAPRHSVALGQGGAFTTVSLDDEAEAQVTRTQIPGFG